MKTLLQFALAALARIDLATLRNIWSVIERLVGGFELAKEMSGQQKLDYVIERVGRMVPEKRRAIGTQIIRAIVEIVLIAIRTKGVGK